jgi:hypothetical protein
LLGDDDWRVESLLRRRPDIAATTRSWRAALRGDTDEAATMLEEWQARIDAAVAAAQERDEPFRFAGEALLQAAIQAARLRAGTDATRFAELLADGRALDADLAIELLVWGHALPAGPATLDRLATAGAVVATIGLPPGADPVADATRRLTELYESDPIDVDALIGDPPFSTQLLAVWLAQRDPDDAGARHRLRRVAASLARVRIFLQQLRGYFGFANEMLLQHLLDTDIRAGRYAAVDRRIRLIGELSAWYMMRPYRALTDPLPGDAAAEADDPAEQLFASESAWFAERDEIDAAHLATERESYDRMNVAFPIVRPAAD